MGCTSSAPKMVKPRANSEVDPVPEEHRIEETKDSSKEIETHVNVQKETNVANVLPNMCDNLVDPTQLDRNYKIIDASKSDNNEKDHQSSGRIEIDHKINMDDKNEAVSYSAEDKLSTMEEVVDRVMEMYIAEGGVVSSSTLPGTTDDANVTEDERGGNKTKNYTEHHTDESEPIDTKADYPAAAVAAVAAAGVVSPSQSEGSRATRWEALADVAAELPPSLAVDPITGQIYALSK